jgi:hypothetical protein
MQNNQVGRPGRIDRAGDFGSLEFSRVAHIQEGISGVFFRQMVVGVVSIIDRLAGTYDCRLRQLLLAEVR